MRLREKILYLVLAPLVAVGFYLTFSAFQDCKDSGMTTLYCIMSLG